jgi:uncharacterized protein (DUF362 family)
MTHKTDSHRTWHSNSLSRRGFLKLAATAGTAGLLAGCRPARQPTATPLGETAEPAGKGPVVSVVKIKGGKIDAAVEEALDLLGGVESVAKGKDRIMLKPNLTTDDPNATTRPEVIRSLAKLMKKSGKEVLIGEGSSAVGGFNVKGDVVYRTNDREILDGMQQFVFDSLGYTELAKSMQIPLTNLHSGEMVDVEITNGLAFDKITLHRSLTEIDLLCSVPMMKTHVLATVTLGMKNLIGLYPGTVYRSVRAGVHDHAADAGSPGIAFEIIDMVKANKLGLTVIDGSTAMEGDGPSDGNLVQMDVIVAGTNPLATDMVAASLMGFETGEIPTFTWANKVGMQPQRLDEIEVRGEKIENVRRNFVKPRLYAWNSIRKQWGVQEIP